VVLGVAPSINRLPRCWFLQFPFICESPSILSMPSHTTSGAGTKLPPAHVAVVPPGRQSSTKPVVRLFSGLSDHDITDIMASGVVRRFAKGKTIVRANDPGTHLFLVKTGSVDYYRLTAEGQQVLIIRLSPGDTFGLGTLLPKPIGYIATAEALRETEVHVWEHPCVRKFARKHPLLTENALRISLEYIRLYSDRHLALVSGNAETRLSRMLGLVGARTGQRHPRGLEVRITNERLASLADVGYYTTSRLLSKWERKGAIEKSRGKVVIRCPEGMLGITRSKSREVTRFRKVARDRCSENPSSRTFATN